MCCVLILNLLIQIKEEFRRIKTKHLEQTFLTNLDTYTAKLLDMFNLKGGVTVMKIRPMLNSLSQVMF